MPPHVIAGSAKSPSDRLSNAALASAANGLARPKTLRGMLRDFMTAKTALITGTSSGIGLATARHFAEEGWNVVATMRAPAAQKVLTPSDTRFVTALDVTDPASIARALD